MTGLVRQDAKRDAVGIVERLRIEAELVRLAGVSQGFNFDECFTLVARRQDFPQGFAAGLL